jgi:hypothetical protein
VKIALFNAVAKALQRTRLVGVSAVNENSRLLAFEREPEVNIAAEPVGDVNKAKLIKFIVNLRIGVLKHVLLALKNTEH